MRNVEQRQCRQCRYNWLADWLLEWNNGIPFNENQQSANLVYRKFYATLLT